MQIQADYGRWGGAHTTGEIGSTDWLLCEDGFVPTDRWDNLHISKASLATLRDTDSNEPKESGFPSGVSGSIYLMLCADMSYPVGESIFHCLPKPTPFLGQPTGLGNG